MTTLNQIRSHSPSPASYNKLLKHLGKTLPDDEPLSLLTVLDGNGLADAIWCLRTEPTPERTQRFALAVARRVEHLSPKACNDVTERYLSGTATGAELEAELEAADAADAARAAAYAARAARATDAADAAAYTALVASDALEALPTGGAALTQLFREIFQ